MDKGKDKNNNKYKPADLVADYKLVFESEAGERVLYDLMKKCHFYILRMMGMLTVQSFVRVREM